MVTDLTSLGGAARAASLASGVARAAIDDCDRSVNVSLPPARARGQVLHTSSLFFLDLAVCKTLAILRHRCESALDRAEFPDGAALP